MGVGECTAVELTCIDDGPVTDTDDSIDAAHSAVQALRIHGNQRGSSELILVLDEHEHDHQPSASEDANCVAAVMDYEDEGECV